MGSLQVWAAAVAAPDTYRRQRWPDHSGRGAGCRLLRVDLTPLLNGGDVSPQSQQQSASISPQDDQLAKFTSVVLASTEDNWQGIFKQMGKTIRIPNW